MKQLLVVIVAGIVMLSAPTVVSAAPVARKAAHRSSRKARRRSSHRWRIYRHGQRSPSRERYKQIQAALAERGYSPGRIDGRWGSKTASALKRFERDHDLPADGKLDSLVLITLGLGPEHHNGISPTRGTRK